MTLWLIAFIVIGVLLTTGIERLLRRLGVHRVAPEDASGGFHDVLNRLRQATEERHAEPGQQQRRNE